jgi:hydroxymethylpyrimidine/phosphomethylpyrimidine kinase
MSELAPTPKVTALTVAGSDPSGGAGLQADLRAFDALGVHGASVVTLITAQGTRGVRKVDALRPELVRAQLAADVGRLVPPRGEDRRLGTAGAWRSSPTRCANARRCRW